MKLNYGELVKQKNIDLSNSLNDDNIDVLIKVIEQSTILEKLYLHYNKLTLADGKLAAAIAKNKTLKLLSLWNNNVSDEGVKHLAGALKENNTLQQLNLYNNNIGDEGAKYIADMLAVNKTLQWFSLSNNNISDKGANSIAASLVVNTGIQKIYLGDNNIRDKGAEKLADALKSNNTIKNLLLHGNNNISKDVMDRIKAILNDTKRKIANKMNDTANKEKVAVARVTPSDSTDTSINNNGRSSSIGGDPSIGMGKKPTPEQYEQMMAADRNAKQSSASSSLTNCGSTSDQKMPASNNKRDTENPLAAVHIITNPTNNDIISGKGAGIQNLKGNERFRQLVLEKQASYLQIAGSNNSPREKTAQRRKFEEMLMEKVHDYGGRFLTLNERFGIYTLTSEEEALKKIRNLIRKKKTSTMPAVSTVNDNDLPDGSIVIRTPSQKTSASDTTEAQGPSTSCELKVEDALQYMDRVRREFGDHLHIYYEFLEIMQKSKAQEMDTNELIHRIRRLFHGHIDLILGFNAFLPDGYMIKMKEGYKPPHPGRESQPPKKRQRLSEPIMGGLNPQRLNFGTLSSSPGSSTQPVDFDPAIDYVTTIKKRFAGNPEIYRKFLQILHVYQKEQLRIKEVVDKVSLLFEDHADSADLLKRFVFFLPDAHQAQAKKQLEVAIKKAEEKKKASRPVNEQFAKQKDLTRDRIEDSSRQKKHEDDDELTKVKEQLNSALKEKEDAQKLVASMKADIIRKEEELEMKEQEIKSKAGDIAQRDQENERLKNELADAQKKVVTIGQEKDTTIAQKDQQLQSALERLAESDKDIAKKNKQLESIKRILTPGTADDEGGQANKRTRTEDTPAEPKVKSVQLDYEDTHCSICTSKFSIDTDSSDENIRKHLPVLSSSKTCDHYFCHGCILKRQAAIAEEKRVEAPKWIPCMECRTITSFCPSEPKYHRFLIRLLKKAKWVEAPKVKEELAE